MVPYTLAAGLPLPPPSSLPQPLGEAHFRGKTSTISTTTPSCCWELTRHFFLACGIKERSLHRAVRVDTVEVLLVRRFIGLDLGLDNKSPRD